MAGYCVTARIPDWRGKGPWSSNVEECESLSGVMDVVGHCGSIDEDYYERAFELARSLGGRSVEGETIPGGRAYGFCFLDLESRKAFVQGMREEYPGIRGFSYFRYEW